MKCFVRIASVLMFLSVVMFSSCSTDTVRKPEYHGEILLDEDLNIVDMGRAGQSTDDRKYYYNGSVTLYNEDGGSRTFPCYLGRYGLERGCRGVVYAGDFYNLDRNKWVIIGGVKYKASNLVD